MTGHHCLSEPRPLRILHVITQLELGGAQQSMLQILSHLDRSRYRPSLVSADGLLSPVAQRIPDLPICFLRRMRSAVDPLSLFHDAVNFIRLMQTIRRGDFHIVHTHSSKAGILARWAAYFAGVPVIIHTVHGFGFHAFQPVWLRKIYQSLERLTARITHRLIVVSDRDFQTGLALGIGTPSKYRLIRYGINAKDFYGTPSACEAKSRLGLDPNRSVVGTVACLKPQKGPFDFLKACCKIAHAAPGTQFLIAGDGKLRVRAQRLCRQLGLEHSLHFLGWRDDIPNVLAAMDVFMLASRWEGLPITCLEAFATGLPVVATTAGGIPDLVKNGENGFLSPVAHPDHLAEAAIWLLKDSPLRLKISRLNQSGLGKRFTLQHMISEVEKLYDGCVKEKAA